MDNPVNPEVVDFDFKKLKDNSYLEATVLSDTDCVKKGDKVVLNSTEVGTMDDNSIITCYTKDGKEVMIQKSNLEIDTTPTKSEKDDEK